MSYLFIEHSDSEDYAQYKPGGYHAVALGETYNEKYFVVRKLGYGHFSTVWLCYDFHSHIYVAMKVMRSAPHYTETAKDEIGFFSAVAQHAGHPNAKRIVHFYGSFFHKGPNGKHMCMIFELLSSNLRGVIKFYNREGLPLAMVRSVSKQVLEGLEFLHDTCNVIHTDLKPDNVMLVFSRAELNVFIQYSVTEYLKTLKSPCAIEFYDAYHNVISSDTEVEVLTEKNWDRIIVKIGDLGNGCYTYRHFSSRIQTRQYRCPEVILGIPYNETSDIWSFACMVFKMLTGNLLFKPKETAEYAKEDHHLSLFLSTLGPFDKEWAKGGKHYRNYFRSKSRLRRAPLKRVRSLKDLLIEKYYFHPTLAEELFLFITPMLEYIPEKRASARSCLSSPWLNPQLSTFS